jgi:hypothetical protein
MAIIANVALTDTFDLWRTRTNQLAVQSNGFEAYIVNLYERSNNSPTYVYANNIGTQANAYTNSAISAANVAVGNGANAFARTIGISSNSYTNTAISAANVAVGNGANAYSRVIGTSSNGYAVFVGASANSSTDTKVANEAALARNATNLTGGTVALARGGTGTSLSASQGGVVYGTLAGMAINGAGVSGQVLTSAGTSPPTWTAQSSLQVGYATAAGSAGSASTATSATTATTATSATTAGTVTTAAQPSITSVGTLTSLAVSGAITAGGDITAFSASDKRLKTNISQIQDSLHKVNSISGVTFDWNEEGQKSRQVEEEVFGNRREAGVIAQEIEEVLPEVVVTRKDGYKAVRYEKLVPLLIEAIKELTAKVEMLESKVGK